MKKTTLIGILWVASIATGLTAQFTDIMYLSFLAIPITFGAFFATAVYVTDNWNNFK